MKTILQALKDEIHYKLSNGFFENRLLSRMLKADDECTTEVFNGKLFKGAVADCLSSLVDAPDFSEGDISFSLSDRDKILKRAYAIYQSIGEHGMGEPTVYIGE